MGTLAPFSLEAHMQAMIITGAIIFGAIVLIGLAGCADRQHWSATDLERPAVTYQHGKKELQDG